MLYQAPEPAEAWRLAFALEIHYTPTHGSWLNAAEIELAMLSTQCLDQRLPDVDSLRYKATASVEERNAAYVTVKRWWT